MYTAVLKMMHRLRHYPLLGLFFGVVLNTSGPVSAECPDTWVPFRASCYHFGHSSLTFQEAEQFCVHYGAHLLDINSAAENTFIKSYLSDLRYPKFWIGLRDDIVEGMWTWYDTDNAANFTSWDHGEPNGGKAANCAAIFDNHAYNWVDEPCTNMFRPVCEQRNEKSHCTESIVG